MKINKRHKQIRGNQRVGGGAGYGQNPSKVEKKVEQKQQVLTLP